MLKNRFLTTAAVLLLLATIPSGFALAQGPTGFPRGGVVPAQPGPKLPNAPLEEGCLDGSLGPGLFGLVEGTRDGYFETHYFAGVLYFVEGDHLVPGFCMDLKHEANPGECGFVKAGPASAEIYWILLHYPASLSLSGEDAAAIQAAIWYYTDGFIVTAPEGVVNKTAAIKAAVPAVPSVIPQITFSPGSLTRDAATFDINITVTATREGTPLVGKTLTLSTDAGTLSTSSAITDGNGEVKFNISNATGKPLTAQVTATLSFVESTRYTKEGRQTLLFAAPANAQGHGMYGWTRSPSAVTLTSLSAASSGPDLSFAAMGIATLSGTVLWIARRKRFAS